jgi:UDP-glucuronate 4-epimerase
MQTVLVTGGAGFIGSHFCECLVREGIQTVCLDNFDTYYDPAVKRRNIAGLMASPRFETVEGDIRDLSLLRDLCKRHRFDGFVHLAARAGVRPSIQDPLLYADVNVRGTLNVLEICREFRIQKLVFASSSSVYGETKKIPFSEEDPADFPISPYGATKRAGELLCYTYHRLYGIDVACLRFFTSFGPRQRPEMAIHKFTRLIHQGKAVPMYGDGGSQRDYTYIRDIIDGLFKALLKNRGYDIYNLGESRTTRLIDLIRMIEKALGKKARIERYPDQPGDVPITYADITKAREKLGYNPRFDIEEGIRRFVRWYRNPEAPMDLGF